MAAAAAMRSGAMKRIGTGTGTSRSNEVASSSASGANARQGADRGQHRARSMMTMYTATAAHNTTQMCRARSGSGSRGRSRAQSAEAVTCSVGQCGSKYRLCSVRTHNTTNNTTISTYASHFFKGKSVSASRVHKRGAASNGGGRAMSCRAKAMKGFEIVGDIMTTAPLVTCNEDMSVDAALELVVGCRVTGLPVVDEEGRVVGVVSDYDLLALEDICGSNIVQPEERSQVGDMFPPPGATWKAFNEVQVRLAKSKGKKVADVMTPSPTVVRPYTNLEDAARILLTGRFRRLPVVDNDNRLIGILTRGNIVSAALLMKRLKEKKAEEEAKV